LTIEQIPEFMGGQCRCEEYGGCINSNIGPWNDYEIYGNGIRRKGAAATEEEEAKTEEVTTETVQVPVQDNAGAATH